FYRGYALGRLGRYEEAIASYDKALEIQPDYHEAIDNRQIAMDNIKSVSNSGGKILAKLSYLVRSLIDFFKGIWHKLKK
ncbi:MAG TPA: hypothetical protein DCF68_04330, partial [Cyanothece sp. UBA12306]|nr:hypothetical protein [Cyanothece sp. UBA12306]